MLDVFLPVSYVDALSEMDCLDLSSRQVVGSALVRGVCCTCRREDDARSLLLVVNDVEHHLFDIVGWERVIPQIGRAHV